MTRSSAASSPLIIIIGAGFGGLGMAIKLKKAGIDSFTVLEKGSGVGGTWRDNTYPGAACDVQSHFYSYSFEPKHDWTRKFGLQNEILGYMEHCVEKYALANHIRFNSPVGKAHFNEAQNQWSVTLTNGEELTANVVITATGQLNQPAWPRIEGIDRFAGTLFHSARWDHSYDFANKRVAVIGTGASAIQFVPELAKTVKSLNLFQRSAAWVLPKPDRPFKRWEQALFRAIPAWDRLYRYLIYWKNESRALVFTRLSGLLEIFARKARREAKKHVTDPEKLKHVIPDYQIGCKRILISNDWYPAINQSNVSLVTDAIDHIDTDGIVTRNGEHHPVDAIICGTGFQASDFLAPMEITGRAGVNLNKAWETGASAFKGITVSGFPNLFMLYGPNTNLAHNSIVFMLESQIRYVLDALEALKKYPGSAMDVRQDRQERFSSVVQEGLEHSVWSSGCTSWYLDANGKNTVNWPGFTFTYRLATRRVDTADYQFIDPPRGA
ncbi:NAD(P)/FAD-dependent oxidoreductase [Marinobacter alexandrii]|uniref:flavin-containing monooxygenase n=1 Tax=Marinobacter alexandrii TaxID=2570351 RepID=UPI001FFF95F2|nr:NAD(P)/FAD-dependent oxidoreductase [Marinobacter alexandrii]MCK2148825.1 NAD(P)/FAD-dependent oxidoreductase [Marinobacter alexandrii]